MGRSACDMAGDFRSSRPCEPSEPITWRVTRMLLARRCGSARRQIVSRITPLGEPCANLGWRERLLETQLERLQCGKRRSVTRPQSTNWPRGQAKGSKWVLDKPGCGRDLYVIDGVMLSMRGYADHRISAPV